MCNYGKYNQKSSYNYRKHAPCVFSIKFHLVLVTKYRRKCLIPSILARLEGICGKVGTSWDVEMHAFGGEPDHFHLLLDMHPNIMPGRFINNLKRVTSRLISKEFAIHLKQYYYKPVLWTRAYCLISAGGAPLSTLRDYIQNQGQP